MNATLTGSTMGAGAPETERRQHARARTTKPFGIFKDYFVICTEVYLPISKISYKFMVILGIFLIIFSFLLHKQEINNIHRMILGKITYSTKYPVS